MYYGSMCSRLYVARTRIGFGLIPKSVHSSCLPLLLSISFPLPRRTFRNFRASKPFDRRFLTSYNSSMDEFRSNIVKCLVMYTHTYIYTFQTLRRFRKSLGSSGGGKKSKKRRRGKNGDSGRNKRETISVSWKQSVLERTDGRGEEVQKTASPSIHTSRLRQNDDRLRASCFPPDRKFQVGELQNPFINVSEVHKSRRTTDFAALKLWNGRSECLHVLLLCYIETCRIENQSCWKMAEAYQQTDSILLVFRTLKTVAPRPFFVSRLFQRNCRAAKFLRRRQQIVFLCAIHTKLSSWSANQFGKEVLPVLNASCFFSAIIELKLHNMQRKNSSLIDDFEPDCHHKYLRAL